MNAATVALCFLTLSTLLIEDVTGVTYYRWGRTKCDGYGTTVVYKGYMAGSHYNIPGGGSNYLCLPQNPQFKTIIPGMQTLDGVVYGINYQIWSQSPISPYYNSPFSLANNGGNELGNGGVPCVVCFASDRYNLLEIPAQTACPYAWTMEYSGYLVSEFSNPIRNDKTMWTCLDGAPESTSLNNPNDNSQVQGAIYPVQVACGTIPCGEHGYVNGNELNCVVCTI